MVEKWCKANDIVYKHIVVWGTVSRKKCSKCVWLDACRSHAGSRCGWQEHWARLLCSAWATENGSARCGKESLDAHGTRSTIHQVKKERKKERRFRLRAAMILFNYTRRINHSADYIKQKMELVLAWRRTTAKARKTNFTHILLVYART
jgi:hypothetical protein